MERDPLNAIGDLHFFARLHVLIGLIILVVKEEQKPTKRVISDRTKRFLRNIR